MTGFRVDADVLDSFGWAIGSIGDDSATIAPYCRQYAGQTTGMSGLLELLQPLVRGGGSSVTGAFADHYESLASVIRRTGAGLQHTAKLYETSERGTLRTLDAQAVVVPGGTDARGDGDYQLGWTGIALGPTAPSDDPGRHVRDSMAIDVRAIDWLFHEATGHHITEPIDAMVGNWTTLWADGAAWDQVSRAWRQISADLADFATQVDRIWDGRAAAGFQAYMRRLAEALQGEADLAAGVAKVLGLLGDKFRDAFQQAIDLLQSVIHQVEAAAAWLAATWWSLVGDYAAVEKAGEALDDFMKTWRLVDRVIKLVKTAQKAMVEYYKVKAVVLKIVGLPAAVTGKIDALTHDLELIGAAPGTLDHLSHLPQEPTRGYGGPDAPGI